MTSIDPVVDINLISVILGSSYLISVFYQKKKLD